MSTAPPNTVLDASAIGFRTAPFSAEVEAGRLRLFNKAIGESDPIYKDAAAARAAGYRDVPCPPTFLFCLEMEREDPYDWFDALGIPLGKVLHGGQHFVYHEVPCAGDTLTFENEVVDVYHKKGGALEFLVQHNTVTNQHGRVVAEFDRTVVIRHDP